MKRIFVAALLAATAPLCAQTITIMPMGDSITSGYTADTWYGGYRSPLYQALAAEGPVLPGLSIQFLGANTSIATPPLTAAGQQYHNGFGGWHCSDLDANLNGVAAPIGGGDSNQGGYLLTGGNGTGRTAQLPTIALLQCGTNDILQGNTQVAEQALSQLVQDFHALSPSTTILVAAIPPVVNSGLATEIAAYDSYIQNTLVPSLSYTRFVDNHSAFCNADGSTNATLFGSDQIHPNDYGYQVMAAGWLTALNKFGAEAGYR